MTFHSQSISLFTTYIVPGVHGRPALQEEVDGGDGGEVADGIAAHTGGVPGAGQVQGGGAAPPLGPHHHELVHRLLHVINLQRHNGVQVFNILIQCDFIMNEE